MATKPSSSITEFSAPPKESHLIPYSIRYMGMREKRGICFGLLWTCAIAVLLYLLDVPNLMLLGITFIGGSAATFLEATKHRSF